MPPPVPPATPCPRTRWRAAQPFNSGLLADDAGSLGHSAHRPEISSFDSGGDFRGVALDAGGCVNWARAGVDLVADHLAAGVSFFCPDRFLRHIPRDRVFRCTQLPRHLPQGLPFSHAGFSFLLALGQTLALAQFRRRKRCGPHGGGTNITQNLMCRILRHMAVTRPLIEFGGLHRLTERTLTRLAGMQRLDLVERRAVGQPCQKSPDTFASPEMGAAESRAPSTRSRNAKAFIDAHPPADSACADRQRRKTDGTL